MTSIPPTLKLLYPYDTVTYKNCDDAGHCGQNKTLTYDKSKTLSPKTGVRHLKVTYPANGSFVCGSPPVEAFPQTECAEYIWGTGAASAANARSDANPGGYAVLDPTTTTELDHWYHTNCKKYFLPDTAKCGKGTSL